MYTKFFNAAFVFYAISCVLFFARYIFKKPVLRLAAVAILLAGVVNNILAVTVRWQLSGYPPMTNLHEALVLVSFFLAAGCLISDIFYALPFPLAGFAAFFSFLAFGYASFLDSGIKPLLPALKSNWLLIHVTSYFLGYAACFTAFAAAVVFLVNKGSRDSMEKLCVRSVKIAFPFLTLGLTTGSVWANLAWGRYWGWDPKETWSLVTWVIYVTYLHVYNLKEWRGKRSAYLAIAGFAAIIFTFIGVTLFLKGKHSYS
jgi:ABC-type transport system involved in cytochrome c biogenesis permease subunit